MKIKEILNDNILRGLGDSWEMFFADKLELKAHLQSNEYAMSRAYFKLIGMFLQNSLTDFPLFSEELWAPIKLTFDKATFDEKQKFRDPLTGIDMNGYIIKLTHNVKGIKGIYNKIVHPELTLKENYDYIIRELVVEVSNQEVKVPCLVLKENIFESEFINKKQLSSTEWELNLWGAKVQYESTDFYDMYGRFVTDFVPNKDSYKAFVEGLWYFYVKGPTVKRIETAINLLMGFPVIRHDNETITDIQESRDITKIITNKSIYSVKSSAELQPGIVEGATTTIFMPIVKAVTIDDYITTPAWWDGFQLSTTDYDPTGTGNEGLDREMKLDDGSGSPNTSYEIFDKYLKWNRFNILVDVGAALYANNVNDLMDIIGPGLPLYIDYYFGLVYNFEDNSSDGFELEEDMFININDSLIDHFFENSDAWFFGYGHESQAMWYFVPENNANMKTWGELETNDFRFIEDIGYDSEYKGGFFLDAETQFKDEPVWYFTSEDPYLWGAGDRTIQMPYMRESERNEFGYTYTTPEEGYEYTNFRFKDEKAYDELEMKITADNEDRNGVCHTFRDNHYWAFRDVPDIDFSDCGTGPDTIYDGPIEMLITDDYQENVIIFESEEVYQDEDIIDPITGERTITVIDTLEMILTANFGDVTFGGLFFLDEPTWTFDDIPFAGFSSGDVLFQDENSWSFTDTDPTLFEYPYTFNDVPTWNFGDLDESYDINRFEEDHGLEELDMVISMDFEDESIYADDPDFLQFLEANSETFSEASLKKYKEYFSVIEECSLIHYDPDLPDPTLDVDYVSIII